jgi:hypothetical protein
VANPDSQRHEPGARPGARATAQELDRVAWSILSDLLRVHDVAGALHSAGLQRLIELRLDEEAKRTQVPVAALTLAFERAIQELTGAGRPPRPEPPQPQPQPESQHERDASHE